MIIFAIIEPAYYWTSLGMNKTKSNPRKFSEKIALLNKKEAEGNAEFQRILKEVEETTRVAPPIVRFEHQQHYQQQQGYHQEYTNQLNIEQSQRYWPIRSSSFSNWPTSLTTDQTYNQSQHHQNSSLGHQQLQQQHLQQSQQQTTFVSQEEPSRLRQNVLIESSPIVQRLQHPEQQLDYQQPILAETHQEVSNLTSDNPNQINHLTIREVPNIEIFSIDSDYDYSQHQTNAVTTHHPSNNLTNDYRNNAGPTQISSTRSLPNIACLSVASSPSCHPELAPTLSQQRLIPSNDLNISAAMTSAGPSATTTTTEIQCNMRLSGNNLNNDHIFGDATSGAYFSDQQEYCYLPVQNYQNVESPQHQTCSNNQANVLDSPWQQVVTTSVSSSPAHTPPPFPHPNNPSVQMTCPGHPSSRILNTREFTSSSNQSLRPQFSSYGPTMVRASSTNVLNRFESNDLLDPRPINTNLSKSTEVCYGYMPT